MPTLSRENFAASTVTPEEHTLLERLDRLLPLQREKLYELFRHKHIADRNDPRYLQEIWDTDPRWKGIERRHSVEDVLRLRGDINVEYTRAHNGAEKLWDSCHSMPYLHGLGVITGHQAVQTVATGCPVVYVGGWNVAADGNETTLTDQSIYEAKRVPEHVHKINNALEVMSQIHRFSGTKKGKDWMVPIVADMEAGYGREANVDMVTRWNIEAGAAAIHIEDQLVKKCGHMSGIVLRSLQESETMLQSVRLQADVLDVPLVIIARTDAVSAGLIASDIDARDRPFLIRGERTPEGYYGYRGGIEAAIARGIAYCRHADMIWFESKTPDLAQARTFAEAIHARYPGKLLAYNCSGNFNWKANFMSRTLARHGVQLDVKTIATMGYQNVAEMVNGTLPHIGYQTMEKDVGDEMAAFQVELGKLGYKFQFVTTAGFWVINTAMFELGRDYHEKGMAGFSALQERAFALKKEGFDAAMPQTFVGVQRADFKVQCANAGKSSTTAFKGSTEAEQFSQKPS